MNNSPVYEIVVFKANEGITPEQVIAGAQSIQPFLENYEGYISRQLIQTDDNQWVDFVTWEGLEQAHAAAEDIMKQPEAGQFMRVINPDSINMMHGTTAFLTSLKQATE